jgi:hypothetical protein
MDEISIDSFNDIYYQWKCKRAAYKLLEEEERQGPIGESMQKEIESLNASLKTMEASVGRYYGPGDNYTESIKE